MIATLRTLTRKSKINFGTKHKDDTVQILLNERKHKTLIFYYFRYTSINFTEDILEELKLTEPWRIHKPGSDCENLPLFLNSIGIHKKLRNRDGANIMKKSSKVLSNSYLQSKNHGH